MRNLITSNGIYRLGSGGLEEVKDAVLKVGQIIWLNGYGQSKGYHDRQASGLCAID